mgnify:CR=1 FL=1
MSYLKCQSLRKWWIGLILIFLAILGFFIYANVLSGDFIWDDEYLVQKSEATRDLANLPLLFQQDVNGFEQTSSFGYYRPLAISLYALGYFIAGLDVRIYHFINIFVHVLATLSACYLVYLLFGSRLVAVFCGALFLTHPVQTEAVAYISGLADPLSALFIFWSLIFYVEYTRSSSKLYYALLLLGYTLALLAKENSLILIPVLLLYHVTFKVKFKFGRLVPLLCLTAAYLYLRLNFFAAGLPSAGASAWIGRLGRIPGFFAAITSYFRILFLPAGLHMEYGNRFFSWAEPPVILGISIVAGLLGYAYLNRGKNKLFFFAVLWFLITLLPCASIYPMLAFYMAEHYLYLPSLGFFLVIAQGLKQIYLPPKTRRLAAASFAILLLFYGYLTVKQNAYWQDQVVFYTRTLNYAPQSAKVHYNLGRVYGFRHQFNLAITAYQKAIALDPGYKEALFNLALAYFEEKQYPLAIIYCQRAQAAGYLIPPRFLELLKPYWGQESRPGG